MAKVTAVHTKRVLSGGKRNIANAERDCHRKFQRLGFSLPLSIQSIQHELGEEVLTTNWVKVSHWLKYLLTTVPSVLGSPTTSLEEQCKTFWHFYRYKEPNHVVYQSGKDLGKCLPLNLYGDEGRGPKRSLYLEMTFETAFGVFDHEGSICNCSTELRKIPRRMVPDCQAEPFCDTEVVSKITTNLKGHSYLSKHLVFGLPAYLYKAHPEVLQSHLRLLSEDMRGLYEHGVRIGDSTWYGICIGMKGDMKFYAETTCNFNRSFANLGRKNESMMCYLCHAGTEEYPFEEVDDIPSWTRSIGLTRPWLANETPHLATVQFHSLGHQERMFVLDPFHVMKVGMSRDVCGSLIVLLCRLSFFDYEDDDGSRDIETRLQRAHGCFKLWCADQRKSPGLRSFTRAFMNAKTFAMTPWSNSKGSDSTLLLKFLSFYLGLLLATDPQDKEDFLRVARSVVDNIITMHRLMESHGLFLDKKCAQLLYVKMTLVAKGYHLLAQHALGFGMVGFGVKPKYHSLRHLAFDIRKQIEGGASYIVNPNMNTCESNEDHVGKVSTLARRVSTRTIGYRVIQRYFLKSRALFTRHKRKYGKGLL